MFNGFTRCGAPVRYFARREKDRQFLAGELNYAAAAPISLILPLPISVKDKGRAVDFINIDAYKTFFRDLERTFARDAASPRAPKAVPPVEHLEATFMWYLPDSSHFQNLEHAGLSTEFWSQLPQYSDYGFVVLSLPETDDKIKGVFPFAFSFKTRLPEDSLFFPTLQLHNCHLSQSGQFNYELYYQGKRRLVSDFPSTIKAEESVDKGRARTLIQEGAVFKRHLYGKFPNSDVIA